MESCGNPWTGARERLDDVETPGGARGANSGQKPCQDGAVTTGDDALAASCEAAARVTCVKRLKTGYLRAAHHPRRQRRGLIEAPSGRCKCSTPATIRGDNAAASLKQHGVAQRDRRGRAIRGDNAAASLKPHDACCTAFEISSAIHPRRQRRGLIEATAGSPGRGESARHPRRQRRGLIEAARGCSRGRTSCLPSAATTPATA